MMNNKNNKNTLMQSVAYGPHAASMALRLKASFHASPAAIMALLAKHRLHQSKNLALRAEKPIMVEKMFFSEAMFLLLDVCNNDSYVIRAVAWA
jgi:hypothetical protein